MNIPSMFMFSHDNFRVGQDGPTHQCVEQLGELRLIPNLYVYRPCNMTELLACYDNALSNQSPSCIILSKEILKNQNNNFNDAKFGGYIISGDYGEVEILATGSEVELAQNVKSILEGQDIKVVVASFPCLEIFENQTDKYKNDVLSRANFRVSLEASNDNIWHKYLDKKDILINVTDYGYSASMQDLDKFLGFIPKKIVAKIKRIVYY